MGDFWVFGYGSLIWRPGFCACRARRARLHGYRRSLCVYSFVHRGTRERPGLVLGLDRGGSCVGLAFRVPGDLRDEVIAYLRERELVTMSISSACSRFASTAARRETVDAVAYIVDRQHEQYAGALDAADAARVVRGAVGQSGNNEDYVLSTLEHLEALGIRDHWLEDVARQVAPDLRRHREDLLSQNRRGPGCWRRQLERRQPMKSADRNMEIRVAEDVDNPAQDRAVGFDRWREEVAIDVGLDLKAAQQNV